MNDRYTVLGFPRAGFTGWEWLSILLALLVGFVLGALVRSLGS